MLSWNANKNKSNLFESVVIVDVYVSSYRLLNGNVHNSTYLFSKAHSPKLSPTLFEATLADILISWWLVSKFAVVKYRKPRLRTVSFPAAAAAPPVYFFCSLRYMSTHSAVQSSSFIITLETSKHSRMFLCGNQSKRINVNQEYISILWFNRDVVHCPTAVEVSNGRAHSLLSSPATIMTCLTGIDHYIGAGVEGWKPGQCELCNHYPRPDILTLCVHAGCLLIHFALCDQSDFILL